MTKTEVIVQSTGEIVQLSDEATELLQKPVPIMPFIEDVYSVETAAPLARRWYVVFVKPEHGTPDRVKRFGERHGLHAYWPNRVRLVKRGRGQHRRSEPAAMPLMQRYVLMHMPEREPPFGLLTSHEGRFNGVCGFLGNSEGPIPVPGELVDRLVERERAGEFDETVKRGRKVVSKLPDWAQVNELVRIKAGPFAGHNGMVEEHTPTGKLKVGLMVFGAPMPVEMPLDYLDAA